MLFRKSLCFLSTVVIMTGLLPGLTRSIVGGDWELSSPSQLRVVAVLHDTQGLNGVHDVEVQDGIAYLAGKGGSLAIVDVRNPAEPVLLWSVRDPENYDEAETVMPLGNNRLLVGTRDVLLFNVADPSSPRLLAKIKNRERVDLINGFARDGDRVIGANKLGHIFATDIADRDAIRLIGSRETRQSGELGSPHDVVFCGDLLVVVSPEGFGGHGRSGKLGVYRVTDPQTKKQLPPTAWRLIGTLEHPSLSGANRLAARESIVYVGSSLTQNLDRTDRLRANVSAIDLNNPLHPTLLGGIDFPDNRGPNGLEIVGTSVVAAGGQTVQVIDFSDPNRPRELARLSSAEAFPGGADDAHDLVYQAGHLFVTAQTSHSLVVITGDQTLPGLVEPRPHQ